MRRRVVSVVIVGVLLTAVVGWTSHGSAAPVEPVASPTVTGDCDAAIADMYTVLDAIKAKPAAWGIYSEILKDGTGFLLLDGAELTIASGEFDQLADELPNLPVRTLEGRAFAQSLAPYFSGLEKLTKELSAIEGLADRYGLAVLYSGPLVDLSDPIDAARSAIGDLCGAEKLSYDSTGTVKLDGTPIADPAATPTP